MHWNLNGVRLEASQDLVANNLLVHGNDLDEARDAVSRIFVDHRLDSKVSRPDRPVRVTCHGFDALKLCYFDYGREILIAPDQLQDFYLLMLPLSGTFRIRTGEADLTVGVGAGALLPAERDFHMHWSEDATQMIVRIDKRRVWDCLERLLGQRLTRAPDFALKVNWTDDRMTPLRNAVCSLAAMAGQPLGPGTDKIHAALEDTFLLSLLYLQEHGYSRALADGRLSTACPSLVRRAEAFIEENLCEPFSIDDLVRASGGSARSLFESFNRFRDMSPMRYVRFRRLNRVREELMQADGETRVGTVALTYGFQHMGRFAGEYSKLFGEAPSATLVKSRGRDN